MNGRLRTSLNQQHGVTLIEVLVTVLVLGIGLLGLASLQVTALKSNYSAQARSQASMLAQDIIERMRVNRDDALDGDYDDDKCASHWDCKAWQDSLVAALGAGATGSLMRDDTDVRVSITWNDSRGAIKDGSGVGGGSITFVYATEI